jgi:hypothetical protein
VSRRLLFDLFRVARRGWAMQRGNAERLAQVLDRAGTDVSVARLRPSDRLLMALRAPTFEAGVRLWQSRYFRLGALDARCLEGALRRADRELILGWELSPAIREWLDANGYTYLDMRISPLRFVEDLYLSLSSNRTDVLGRSDTPAFVVAEEPLVDLRREGLRDDACILFVGQTDLDAALLDPAGGIVRWSHHAARVRELARAHGRVLYRPHPQSEGGDIDRFRALGVPFEIDRRPSVYDHFGEPVTFAALSSSVLREARCFGHRTIRLMAHDPLRARSDRLRVERAELCMPAEPRGRSGALLRETFGRGWSPPAALAPPVPSRETGTR